MPLPATVSIIEATVVGRMNEQTILNIFHYYTEAAIVPMGRALANAAAQDFYTLTAGRAEFMEMFHNNYVVQRCTVQQLYGTRMARGASAPAADVPGTRAGTPLPQQTQWSVTTQSDLAGPGSHGGNRFTGACQADQSGGLWNAPFLADAVAGVDPLYDLITLNGIDWLPVIYNRTAPLSSQPVVSFILEDQVRTMRRRVVGRGI